MPDTTNIRRVNFDEDHGALWVGRTTAIQIVKMEPLD